MGSSTSKFSEAKKACEDGNLAKIKELFENKENRQLFEYDTRNNIFVEACKNNNNLEIVKYLISLNFDPTANNFLAFGEACRNGCSNIVHYFIEEGIVDLSNDFVITSAFEYAKYDYKFLDFLLKSEKIDLWMKQESYRIFVEEGRFDTINYFISNGFSSASDKNKFFLINCEKGNLENVKFLASFKDVDPKVYDNYAIRVASFTGNLDLVKYLISLGCDPTAKDNETIRQAIVNGQLEVAKYLYSIGCDPMAKDNSALKQSCIYGQLESVCYLYSLGCTMKLRKDKPIRFASQNGHLNIIKYLVSVGCKIDNNSIRWARKNERKEVVKYFELLENQRVAEAMSFNKSLKLRNYLKNL